MSEEKDECVIATEVSGTLLHANNVHPFSVLTLNLGTNRLFIVSSFSPSQV